VSVSAVLYPRWPPLLKIEISSNGQNFLWEFPIGSYVKLSSAVVAILVGVLKCRTQFWKRTTQESFQQSLVEIGSVWPILLYFKPESAQI
jgi:hypothetical protein